MSEAEEQYPDEQFLVKTEGGPHPGNFVGGPEVGLSWPLPDELPDTDGRYVKVSQSALPPMPPDGHVLRGALYRWEPLEAVVVLTSPEVPEIDPRVREVFDEMIAEFGPSHD